MWGTCLKLPNIKNLKKITFPPQKWSFFNVWCQGGPGGLGRSHFGEGRGREGREFPPSLHARGEKQTNRPSPPSPKWVLHRPPGPLWHHFTPNISLLSHPLVTSVRCASSSTIISLVFEKEIENFQYKIF